MGFMGLNMKKVLFLSAVFALLACTGGEDHSTHDKPQLKSENGSVQGIEIASARVLPPFPGRDTAAAYFTVTNHGESADRLLSVSSPVSDAVEIHNHIEENGVMKMRQVSGGIVLEPGKTVELKQGSYHVMMFKTVLAEDQEDVALTLDYENAEDVTIIAEIVEHGDHGNH